LGERGLFNVRIGIIGGEAIHRMLLVAFLGRQCDVPSDCTNKPLEILFLKSQQNGRF
jgi:hypothetical protein